MHKILKIVALVLSLLGIVFLVRIISEGDEAIKDAYLNGDSGIVDPLAYVTYFTLFLVLGFVVFFIVKNIFTNPKGLKNTLIGVGAFVAVLVIAYAVSGGDTQVYKYNGFTATEGESTMVGAGLVAFYLLMATAAGSMLFSGVKKMIK